MTVVLSIRSLLIILISCSLFPEFICSTYGQTLEREPVRILFDTDMGSDVDDAGALALLHAYADMGKAEIIGCVFSSGKIPYGAGIIQAINIYYGRPEIPVGAYYGDDIGDPMDKMSAEKLARDTSAFGNTIVHNRDAEEQTRLTRKLLATEEDNSVTYVTIGHTKGLYDLLTSQPDDISKLDGRELVKRKINRWVALGALGAINEGGHFTKDWNFFFNGTALYTKYLIENFPVPIIYVDVGTDVLTGKSLKTTPPGNIVRTAYRDWLWNNGQQTFDDQRPSWDLATIYFAVEGVGEFLIDEGRGRLEFDIEKGCRWKQEQIETAQTFVRQKEGIGEQFSAYLNEMIARTPRLNQ